MFIMVSLLLIVIILFREDLYNYLIWIIILMTNWLLSLVFWLISLDGYMELNIFFIIDIWVALCDLLLLLLIILIWLEYFSIDFYFTTLLCKLQGIWL